MKPRSTLPLPIFAATAMVVVMIVAVVDFPVVVGAVHQYTQTATKDLHEAAAVVLKATATYGDGLCVLSTSGRPNDFPGEHHCLPFSTLFRWVV